MPSAAVDTAIRNKLASEWTATPVLETMATETPSGEGFLVVQYPVANVEKPTLQRRYREEGAARFVLNVRQHIGRALALSYADTLADIFRDKKFSGVVTRTPTHATLADANDDGVWFELVVIVPYEYQFND